jgi:hypothetical protein
VSLTFSGHSLSLVSTHSVSSTVVSAPDVVVASWSCLCSGQSTVQRRRGLSLRPSSRESSLLVVREGTGWGSKKKRKKDTMDSTPHCSRVVPHPSTKRAQTALTAVFG